MAPAADNLQDFAYSVHSCVNEEQLKHAISAELANYGYENLAISTFDKIDGPDFLVDMCPDGWFDTYVEKRLFDIDPIFRVMEYEWRPHRWDDAIPHDASKRVREFMGLAGENGLNSGITASASLLGRKLNFVTSAKTKIDLSSEKNAVPMAAMLASVYAGKLSSFHAKNAGLILSYREREMVRWLIDGKTNSEIAEKMNISSKTVEEMLRRVSIKNNLSGRMQIAVNAILHGSINL